MEVARQSSIEASRLLCLVQSNNHTIKDLLYSNNFETNKKELYAIVCKTLDSLATLKQLADSFAQLKAAHIDGLKDNPCNHCLFLISCYESLNSRHKNPHLKVISALTGDPYAFKTIRSKYKTIDNKVAKGDTHSRPIYLRINRFKITKKEVKLILAESFEHISFSGESYEEYVTFIQSLGKGQFTFDYHLPKLIVVFGKGTELFKHTLVKEKQIIIQDKASCIPPMALLDEEEGELGDVIDCCAAPGNKTSFLAHLLTKKATSSTLYAFDRNNKRFAFLQNHLEAIGVPKESDGFKLHLERADFLEVEPNEKRFANVTHILVDPSCSGSGLSISKRVPNVEDKNVKALSSFQAKILKHCFKFPSVKSIVYSTCSIYQEENEDVVSEVLAEVNEAFELVEIWPNALTEGSIHWSHRGNKDWEACLRADQKTDATNGFFVAKFTRK